MFNYFKNFNSGYVHKFMFFLNKIKVFFCLADYISNIFEILRHELKNNEFKNIFLSYFGTWTIMKWCKLANKVCLYIVNIK